MRLALGIAATFVLGNVNPYFNFHPAPDESSLIEVRLTNHPSGTDTYGIPDLGLRTLASTRGRGTPLTILATTRCAGGPSC